MNIGKAIADLRSSRRLSQRQLAELAGVEREHISHWENGHREPSVENLKRLANGIGIAVWEIVQRAEAA